MITCDEIIDTAKAVATNFKKIKVTCKTKNLHILLAFLLITITLFVVVSIYCYLIKYQAKQKHLVPYTS